MNTPTTTAPSVLDKIASRDQAAALLGEFATLQSQARAILDASEDGQRALREQANAEAGPLVERCAAIERELSRWFKKEEKSLGGARSLKLPAGDIGHRDGPPRIEFLKGWNEFITLNAMRGKERWQNFIRQGKDSIDKPKLLTATELHGDPLARVGLRVGHARNQFFIDVSPADTRERVG